MKISVRNLEPTKVKLTVTVDPEEFNPYLDEARKEIAKQVNVPGFRKGHVPGKIIDQRIGFGAVAGEAVNNGVPELYSKALETKKIHPMAQPEIDVQDVPESAKDETKLKFVATVERRPDIELPALDGMEIEVAKAEVTDEDINNRLEALRQRFGTLVSVDRPAAKGDYANIDLNAEIDGETVDSQEGVSYELGSATMLDGLDEALEGLSAGEETSFEGTLEAGKHEGEKALIKVKVNSVKAEELPELDDDFASEASEFDTLDELKEDLKKVAAQDAEGRQATAARDAFIAKLEDGLEIPVPKGVKAEMVEQQLKNVTADPSKATKEQKAEAEETVEKELRDQMVLDVLAETMDVKVSQGEVFNFLASIAQQYGMDPNAFIQAIIRNGQIGSAVQEVGRSKGLLSGMRAVTFKSEGETLDLSAFLGSAAEDEESESVEAASAAAAVADGLASDEAGILRVPAFFYDSFALLYTGIQCVTGGTMNQGFAVVDFETTGLSPAKGDRAIEIGLVHVAPDGTLEDEHETLIHVDRSVGASWVHHITARDLLHAPDFEGIAHELRDLLAGRVFVAHNVSFDSRFLLAEYSRMGASIPVHQSTMLCTMKLSRSLIGRGKLSDCCDYFGIANEDAHSALSDAHATALLLGRLLEADPNWPGFQRRLESAADAAEQWPTFAALPKGQWLPRGTHAAAHAS